MKCYFVLFAVFLFACCPGVLGSIRPIYVRPLTHYALGRDVAEQQQQQLLLQQQQLQKHQQYQIQQQQQQPQLEYVLEDDGDDDDGDIEGHQLQQLQQQQQQHTTVPTALLTMPVTAGVYEDADFTPIYLETNDYSFLPDRMPDLSDDEYVEIADEEHQTPLAYLKQSEQVRLMPNTMSPMDGNALQTTAQPIYITMPIYINTPNAEHQRPMMISMSTLPLAVRPPMPPSASAVESAMASADANAHTTAGEIEEHEANSEEPSLYEEEMEPMAVEEPPSSHYNRLLRNYFDMARAAAHGRAFGPMSTGIRMGMSPFGTGRADLLARARPEFTPRSLRPQMMPLHPRYYRDMMQRPPYGYFNNFHLRH